MTCGTNSSEPFVVKIDGYCDETVNATSAFSSLTSTTCAHEYKFKGSEACATEIPIYKALKTLGPFYGAILIVLGAIMTFVGRKFIFQVLATVIGFVAFAVFFGLTYALFLPIDVSVGLLCGVIAVCLALAVVVLYFTFKFTKKFTVPILAGVAGAVIFVMLGKMAKLHGEQYNFIFAILGAATGVFLGLKFNKFVKAASTALIGSYLLVWGIGQYAPGYPGNLNIKVMAKNPDANWEALCYLAGFVVLAIAGCVYQLKKFGDEEAEENEDDEFKSQDESKVCGCF